MDDSDCQDATPWSRGKGRRQAEGASATESAVETEDAHAEQRRVNAGVARRAAGEHFRPSNTHPQLEAGRADLEALCNGLQPDKRGLALEIHTRLAEFLALPISDESAETAPDGGATRGVELSAG